MLDPFAAHKLRAAHLTEPLSSLLRPAIRDLVTTRAASDEDLDWQARQESFKHQHPRGGRRLHAHVIFTGRYILQGRLSAWAKKCGFGRVADIRKVATGDSQEVARYAAKLAWYGAKAGQAVANLKRRSRTRLRPLRTSRGWYLGGLRRVEEELGIRTSGGSNDPGPWVLVQRDATGVVVSAKFL